MKKISINSFFVICTILSCFLGFSLKTAAAADCGYCGVRSTTSSWVAGDITCSVAGCETQWKCYGKMISYFYDCKLESGSRRCLTGQSRVTKEYYTAQCGTPTFPPNLPPEYGCGECKPTIDNAATITTSGHCKDNNIWPSTCTN